jgi:hypothetical protein
MLKYPCLLSIIFVLFFQHVAFAQSLNDYEVEQLRNINGQKPFKVFVLENSDSHESVVIVGVSYGLVDERHVKSIKDLAYSFTKVFMLEKDAGTLMSKELKKHNHRCTLVQDSSRTKITQWYWGLPTVLFGGAAIMGSYLSYYYPAEKNIGSTLFAAWCAQEVYGTWKSKIIALRSQSMAEVIKEKAQTTKILAIMDTVLAGKVAIKLIDSGNFDPIEVLDEKPDQKKNHTERKRAKRQEPKNEHEDHCSKTPEKSDAELLEEAWDKQEQWEEKRQREIAKEEAQALDERIRNEWERRNKQKQ